MPVEVIMPELGESIVEGTIAKWLKAEGDAVTENEDLVEIITDKVNTTLPAPATGILVKVLAPEGAVVEVAKPIAVISAINDAEQASPAEPSAEPKKAQPHSSPAPKQQDIEPPDDEAPVETEYLRLSPIVRKIARENRLTEQELIGIPGSGSDGRITKNDLLTFISAKSEQMPEISPANRVKSETFSYTPATTPPPKPKPAPNQESEETYNLTGIRKLIADQMIKSYSIPQVTTVLPVDVSKLAEYRLRNKDAFERDYGIRLTYTPFFAKAIASALIEYPALNAAIDGDKVTIKRYVNLGVAVALGEQGEEGLIVPVVKNAHKMSIVELSRAIDGFAKRARKNALEPVDVQGGTFTLTNPGSYGAVSGTPILNAPQTAILGTYAIVKQAVVIDDMIAIRSMMNLALTYDHRLIDGMTAGKFLQRIKATLESVDFL